MGVKTARRKKAVKTEKNWGIDVRAEANGMLLLGESVTKVATDLGIPDRTVREWAQKLGGIDLLRQGRLDELLYKYVAENLETLAAQSRLFREREWLQKQNAADAAVLHGVMSDKSVRILAAIERAKQHGPVPTE